MAHSNEVVEKVKSVLDENEWKYQFNEETKHLRAKFNITGKIRNVQILMDLSYDDSVVVVCVFPINAEEKYYVDVLRLINFINYNSKYGNYELDEEDGEVRFRLTVDLEGIIPSTEMVEKCVIIPIHMMQKYGEDLIAVVMGYKKFEEVREKLIQDKK
ncbi:MAG: YbjN domain-containing protein [Ruminiclostridium sp.]|nr:YbjN domain-containing protein [Ruminiclostridium sp.]